MTWNSPLPIAAEVTRYHLLQPNEFLTSSRVSKTVKAESRSGQSPPQSERKLFQTYTLAGSDVGVASYGGRIEKCLGHSRMIQVLFTYGVAVGDAGLNNKATGTSLTCSRRTSSRNGVSSSTREHLPLKEMNHHRFNGMRANMTANFDKKKPEGTKWA